MNIVYNGESIELKYTFNSFKYMKDFNISELEEIENYVFKLPEITTVLLLGAMNNDPKKVYTIEEVTNFLEDYVVDNSIAELLENLNDILVESNFFKSLQKMEQGKKKKK